jgi:tetratricopeptide (TPR) repeat protein
MDGRRSLALPAFLLAGMIGCKSAQERQSADLAKQTADTTKMVKAQQYNAVTHEPPLPKDKRLKPETLVKLGALKEQAADDAERPQAEKDTLRYQARQAYQKAIDQDPKYTMGYMALVSSYLHTGENDKAHAVFDKALKKNPKSGQLWFELGTVQARAKDWNASLESLGRAVKLDPENKQYQKTYGLALARSGRFDESYALLAKCMSEAEARYNIARMLKHVGQPDACHQQLELALKAKPDFLPARQLLDEMNGEMSVKSVNYEESANPNAGAGPTDPQRRQPVQSGGKDGESPSPDKDGFDPRGN